MAARGKGERGGLGFGGGKLAKGLDFRERMNENEIVYRKHPRIYMLNKLND